MRVIFMAAFLPVYLRSPTWQSGVMRESPSNILLDISRTVARARLPAPTGIDRVERAWIRWACVRGARFLAAFDGLQYLVEVDAVGELLGWLEDGDRRPGLDLRGMVHWQRDRNLRAAQSLIRRRALAVAAPAGLARMLRERMPGSGWYLNTGHDNLDAGGIAAVRDAGFRRAVLIHDTIPVDHPEFARRGTVEPFRRKLEAALEADLLIANSQHTADRLHAHGAGQPITVAPLGIEMHNWQEGGEKPAFVALGTIEPRKNHMLLLNIWQQFWETEGEASPRLMLIGRRGWENREVFEILDRAPMMGRTVFEAGTLDDDDLAACMANATALLFPSHAEGYGLPLAEALAAGVPAIVSDLPALREVGGAAPDYLSPTDPDAWRDRIRDYAMPQPKAREAQVLRLQNWSAPDWRTHFAIVENAMETILVQQGRQG